MKKLWYRHSQASGQTLAEIVVAIGMVLLLVTGLVVGATGSLKAAQYGRSKSRAVGYAQEAMELVRNLRDTSWTTFASYGSPSGLLWCLAQNNTWSPASGGTCPVNVNSIYTRSVKFTWTDPQMKVEVTVTWADGPKTYAATLATYFTQWR